ncbi:MAG: DUF2283 domain-containing protein [SAR202 cluster bacterium]|nr:DUF2283 domain-containing protein [SAR202 cluster bacterium]
MKVIYDSATNTLTIRLKEARISESDELQEGMIADYDAKGNIVGVEILDASERVTAPQNLLFESMGHRVTDGKG